VTAAGSDHISGGDGNDIIFGDAMFSDVLAASHGIEMAAGSGWSIFEQLESAHGWTRADTLNYIQTHLTELSLESGRLGGHDVLQGGAGDDVIFGEEGNDAIFGGLGNDTLSGGSGGDTFVFHAANEGVDHIVDFHMADHDKLDVSEILATYDPLTDSLHNFVNVVTSGADSIVQVDPSGTGLAFQTIVVLEGVHATLDELEIHGNLIA
jgi:Ca2+-binding RTX toxin-like protein